MRKVLAVTLLCILCMPVAAGPAASNWEIRKKPGGGCVVKRVGEKPVVGSRVAGPYPSEKRARTERDRLRDTPKCK